jgi:hypothetical protein
VTSKLDLLHGGGAARPSGRGRLAYHAAPVRILTRSVLVLTLAVVAGACTGDDTPSTQPDATTGPTALPTVDVPVEFVPGEWTYENHDVTVSFTWDSGELTVENGSGEELGDPGLYAVTQTQQRVDADIAGSAPVADGGSAALTAAFPAGLELADVGLVVIEFGEQNWGALAPVVAEV